MNVIIACILMKISTPQAFNVLKTEKCNSIANKRKIHLQIFLTVHSYFKSIVNVQFPSFYHRNSHNQFCFQKQVVGLGFVFFVCVSVLGFFSPRYVYHMCMYLGMQKNACLQLRNFINGQAQVGPGIKKCSRKWCSFYSKQKLAFLLYCLLLEAHFLLFFLFSLIFLYILPPYKRKKKVIFYLEEAHVSNPLCLMLWLSDYCT